MQNRVSVYGLPLTFRALFLPVRKPLKTGSDSSHPVPDQKLISATPDSNSQTAIPLTSPPSVEDGAPGSDDQLPTPHSALRTERSAASAPTPIIPNDPKFNAQWDLKIIGMTNAWAITTGSSNVVVATFDTSTPAGRDTMVAAYTGSTLASLVQVTR
jgi:hypothetical protein